MDLLIGLLTFLVIFAIASLLHLPVLYTIMTNLVNVAAIAVLIIFQPEIRMALSKFSVKGRLYREATEFDKFFEHLSNSIYRLAEKKIGALVVLEHEDKLENFAEKAVILNGKFSSELLETIFVTKTPLHDGAVIIAKEMTILAAAVILPLAVEVNETAKLMGTRHRAALGISQLTDALAIIVSEESGKVSLAKDGVITRDVKADRFNGIIRSLFTPPRTRSLLKNKFNFRNWLRT